MTAKKNIHATALIAGGSRKAIALTIAFGTCASRTRISPPSVAASTANRVCIQGSTLSATPCSSHGVNPGSDRSPTGVRPGSDRGLTLVWHRSGTGLAPV
jgi:hypothetical protein